MPGHQLKPVKSSNIEAIGHDGASLIVKFKSGGTYHYHDVPPEHHDAMLAADSPGGYFHAHVKGKFKHTKMGE